LVGDGYRYGEYPIFLIEDGDEDEDVHICPVPV